MSWFDRFRRSRAQPVPLPEDSNERDFGFASNIPAPPSGLRIGDLQRSGFGWIAGQGGWRRTAIGADELVHGFAVGYPDPGLGALYAADGTVWLQAGERGWDCADLVEVRQRSDENASASYGLVLRDGAEDRVTLTMSPGAEWQRRVDPVYDELDSWFDDIMKTFPYRPKPSVRRPFDWMGADDRDLADWRAATYETWSAGLRHMK